MTANQKLSRRRLLSMSALGGAALLAACTTSGSGGVTTSTLDVARIVTDSEAILSAISAALLSPSIILLLGPNYVAAQAALVAAQLALSEIQTLTGGTVSVTIDTSKIQALVVSLLGDARTVLTLIQGVLGHLSGSEATSAGNVVAAILVLIPLVQLAAGLIGATAGAGSMTEAQALAVIRNSGR